MLPLSIAMSSIFPRSAADPALPLGDTIKANPVCVGRCSYPAQVWEEKPYPFIQFSRVQLSGDNKLGKNPLG